MAEARTDKFQAPSWPTLFAAATALSGVIWYFAPLSTSRPGGAAGPEQAARPGYQNVDARLWQDPLEPALADLRAADKESGTHPRIQIELGPRSQQDKRHKPEALLQEQPDATELIVMPVMLEPGPYPDSAEWRRRARHAVVSALHECHYVPDDGEHIGYITVEELARLPDEDSKAGRPAGAGVVIPFEWFRGQGASSDYVVVLWLDEGSFQQHPLRRLRILLDRLGLPGAKGLPTNWSVKVLGPRGSTTLQAMVADVAKAGLPDRDFPVHDPLWARVDIYCGTATAPDAFVLHRYKSKLPGCSSVTDALGSRGVCFVRTTDDDFDLARALVAELRRRNVNIYDANGDGDLVAIVSESDTFYGRMLPLAFQAAACHCTRDELDCVLNSYSQELPLPHSNAARIHQFSYLRGIDGKLPGESGPTSAQPKPAGGEGASAARPHGSGAADEAPEGQNQYDYLRRLSDELARLDQDERAKHGYYPFKDGGLKAVGVLGSDLYDKLLVLQALRARFPDIVFFTTDVDARMGSPSERRWAHNLVIASSYGLALRQELQGEIPPFRDAYQTATYCAALRALGWQPPKSQSGKPHGPQLAAAQLDRQPISIFEVARSGLFDLAREAHPDLPYPTTAGMIDVTPQLESATSDWWHRWHVGLLLVGALLLTVLILGLVFQMQWERLGLRKQLRPHPWTLLVAAAFIAAFIIWEADAGFIQNGVLKPPVFLIWTSVWVVMLLLTTLVLWRENDWLSPLAWPWPRIAGITLLALILAAGLSLALSPPGIETKALVVLGWRVVCPVPCALVLWQVLLTQAMKTKPGAGARAPGPEERGCDIVPPGAPTGELRRHTPQRWAAYLAVLLIASGPLITYGRHRLLAGTSRATGRILPRFVALLVLGMVARPGRRPSGTPPATDGGPLPQSTAPLLEPTSTVVPVAAVERSFTGRSGSIAGRMRNLLQMRPDPTTGLIAVLAGLAVCVWLYRRHGLPHPWQGWVYLGFVATLALAPVCLIAYLIWREVRPQHEPLWPYLIAGLLLTLAVCAFAQWDCTNWHFPMGLSMLSPQWGAIIPGGLLAGMVAAAAVDVFRRPRLGKRTPRPRRATPPLKLRLYLSVTAVVVLVVAWAVTQNRVEGVPFAFFEGISLWPSEIIRGIAAVLALHFLLEGGRELVRVRRELGSCKADGYWLRGRRPHPHADGSRAALLWRRYLGQCKPRKTVQRVTPTILLYFALAGCLSFILGLPRTPVRGIVSGQVDQYVLLAGVILLLILTVWVVDTTMTARRFIKDLSGGSVAWPDQLLKTVGAKRGMSRDDLADLLDVQFIGRLTTPIMHLIYYPFIVLTLMIVARLNIFADWDWPPALLIIFVLNSAWAVYAAYLLRDAAEKARGKTLRRLREKLLQIQGTGQQAREEKIKETIHEIQSNRKGAFASFTQNPVIGAVLLPASAALLALLGNLSQAQ